MKTHLSPPAGFVSCPCCGKVPTELPATDRITNDPELVSCVGEDKIHWQRANLDDVMFFYAQGFALPKGARVINWYLDTGKKAVIFEILIPKAAK